VAVPLSWEEGTPQGVQLTTDLHWGTG